ncbi:alpha/beta fold hydrolase [Clostridium sp. ZS2-4]|uniref:alpha/beta fold hydrolase n=1 Tax=Clostridium sp. ZS2-4 TaxID=2987703 RepID=UPI00227AAFE2|nr:alpha/beta fold hydrolase [Clostridium sp. ZS2-4]MCY6355935.1 alpha/beta fold hydrolase [Clostridium sp. ZS2-4]
MLSNISINYKGTQINLSTKFRNINNELIFLIHGLGCSKESFEDIWHYSLFDDYSILTVDLVGFGNSSKPHDFSYAIEEQANICKLLLDKFQHPKIHIVAHSMGGAVGLLLAESIKDRLATFINVEGNLVSEDCRFVSRRTIGFPLQDFKDNKFHKMKSASEASENSGIRLWGKMLENSDPLGFYKTSKSLVEWSDSSRLLQIFNNLGLNKIYIHGDKNSQMDVLNQLLSIKKISISNSGHFVMNENPDEFYIKLHTILAT